jgi:outer membrane protein
MRTRVRSPRRARYESGLSALVDVEQARAYLEQSRIATLEGERTLADAREGMREITGRIPGELRPLALRIDATPPSPAVPSDWVARALERNPELELRRLQLQASAQRRASADSAYWPTVNLVAAQDYGLRPRNTLSLQLRWPYFDSGASEARWNQARYEQDGVRAELERASRALVREPLAQYRMVVSSVSLLQASVAAVDAADRSLAATRTGQALGTRTMTDLFLAIQVQALAQNELVQARHRYVLATLLLRQAAGALGEAELAAVNRLLEGAS